MLSERQSLAHEVIVFLGPLNYSGYESVHQDEYEYLGELATDAGGIVSEKIDSLTTMCVVSELLDPSLLNSIPKRIQVLSEEHFMDKYLSDVQTGEEWY
jgi:hypothetical protein